MKVWLKHHLKLLLWILGSLLPLIIAILITRRNRDGLRALSAHSALDKANLDVEYLQGKKDQLLSTLPANHEQVKAIDAKLQQVAKDKATAELQAKGRTDEEIVQELKNLGY